MSAPGVPDRELIEDFEAVLEGSASPEVRRRLAARLERDPAARAWYLRHVEIHAMLEFEHGLAGRPRVSASSLPAGLPELIMPRRRPVLRHATRLTAAAALLIVVALALRWALFGLGPNGVAVAAPYYDRNASPPPMVAYLETIGEDVATESSVELEANRLRPGTIRVASGVAQHVVFDSKVEIVLQGPAVLGVVSASRAALFQGSLELSSPEGVEFVLDAGAVRLVHHDASSRVEVDDRGAVTVEVIRGEVDARAHTRLPRYLWTFDGPVENVVSGELAIAQTGYKRVEGIIGSGAAFFDDTRAASIDVGNGGGGHVGSGGFSVSTGVTIEALIVPRWSGHGSSTNHVPDYDEIFRKEDGDYRILLSFQNDLHTYDKPNVDPGPCLSFGLYLAGSRYSELDVPLDGREGRPTLASLRDGKPHHIVATYDAASGRKALYVDGVLRFEHHFDAGSVVVSGGSAPATIGNTEPGGGEPFHGTIDELAFYDFALSPEEIAQHWANVRRRRGYFGAELQKADTVPDELGTRWRKVATLDARERVRFESRGGSVYGETVSGPREGSGF